MKIKVKSYLILFRFFLLLIFLLNFKTSFSLLKIKDSVNKIPLIGTWDFKIDPYNKGEKELWFKNEHTTINWDTINVPGNWDVRNEYANYAGKAWYKRTFRVNNMWKKKNIRLFFESVYNQSTVWINGKEVGKNELGFLPFYFDINSYLDFDGENSIVVLVDNTLKRGAMWNWGGIRRPVWLEITERNKLEYQHISAIPDFNKKTVPVNVSFEIKNLGQEDSELQYSWTLLKGESIVYEQKRAKSLNVRLENSVVEHASVNLSLSKINLWSFNHPNLYTSILRLYKNGKEIHQLTDNFGIRKIEIDGEQLKLNGELIRTVGFNLVADDRTTGNTLPEWRFKEDVDLMKSAGVNMARISHQPLPKEFLDYLDEKGIMTFEEVALWGKDEMVDPDNKIPKAWLSNMIRYKYNHPSIIGWSVGNEIGFLNRNPKVMEYVSGAIRQVKQEDPTRIAVYVTHSADTQETDAAQFCDMILMNAYINWGKRADKVHKNQPGKPIFYSEYGSIITSEDPNLGKIDAKKMLDEMRNKPYLMGASLWTFNDYRSDYSGTPESENRSWGIVNVFRQKKRAYYTLRKEYSPFKTIKLEGINTVTIQPRDVFDIPAYKVNDYRLVWEANNSKGKIIDGGFLKLPEINPGDKKINKKLVWNQSDSNYASVKLTLIDPQGYAVYDSVAYLIKPEKPKVISSHSESKKIRIVFQREELGSFWKVRYKNKGVINETAETINDFVDELDPNTSYKLSLIAVNSAGESIPSLITVKTSANELPPIIWNTEATDKGFFVGYAVDPKDYLYQFQYGTTSGDYENFNTIQLRNKGVCNIPGLVNGQTYYYRMRRLMQWGFASDWTQEITVIPGFAVIAPETKGVIKNGSEALLVFQPSKKAIGYKIKFTNKRTGVIKYKDINRSQINYILIKELLEKNDYNFAIAAVSSEGISNYSSF